MVAQKNHTISKKSVVVKAVEPVPLSNNSLLIRNIPEKMDEELFQSKLENLLPGDKEFTIDFRPPHAIVQFDCDYSNKGIFTLHDLICLNDIKLYIK